MKIASFSITVRCPFNTNIGTLSLTDFAEYILASREEAEEVLKMLFDEGYVKSSAKSYKSPYFIRNAAVFLSNEQMKLDEEGLEEKDPAVLEADLVAAAEAEADRLEGENIEATDEEYAAAEEYANALKQSIFPEDFAAAAAAAQAILTATAQANVAAAQAEVFEIPTVEDDISLIFEDLKGKEAKDAKAFRRLVRNFFTRNDLPWTIKKGVYYVNDLISTYEIRLEDEKVTIKVGLVN